MSSESVCDWVPASPPDRWRVIFAPGATRKLRSPIVSLPLAASQLYCVMTRPPSSTRENL